MAYQQKLLKGEKLTKENFRTPPKGFGVLPFWFWNGEMSEKEMEWQLKEYKDKGIPGLFIHGRFGEKIGYLSDTWFKRVKFAVDKAKEIGVDTWVYDEMNWPSGTAEKQVLKKYPHLTQKYLELVALNVDGPLFTFLEASDSRYVNTGNSKPIAAFACSEKEFNNGITNIIDLTPNLSFDKIIPWEAPPGKWKLLYFLEKEADYYIDALNPEATERFLEITHEGYKKAVGKSFGSTVPGFFTDEPAMHYYHVGMDNYVIPWSSRMFKIFRDRRGYDLKPFLPALFTDMGKDTQKIRYDFWRTLSEQYSDTYYKRIREWCDENNVIFTGHLLFEEWLRMNSRCEGNIFHHLKHMHITGVDHLYPKIGTEKEPDQHVALKLASSAAHHYGSNQLLCESMGGTYWDCTLERMKWIGNWEYVLGVTIFNNHGYHYSIEGERKRDWPPSQFYHHTWWKYYNIFTDYTARLGHILSGGRHVAKVLVLYPLNSIWTNYVPQSRNDIGNVIESDFNYLTDTLLRLHYDYDYVDEDVLIDSAIRNSRIIISNEEYSVFILPPMTHIKAGTFKKIKEFIDKGGKVIADTILPVELLEYNKKDSIKRIENLFGKNPEELLHNFSNGAKFKVSHKNSKGDVYVIEGKGIHNAGKKTELEKILNKCAAPDVTVSDEDVFYLHREKDRHDVYFFVNSKQEAKGKVEITFEQLAKPELWDPSTGNIKPILPYNVKNGRLSINLNFQETESHIVVLKEKLDSDFVSESNFVVESYEKNVVNGYAKNPKGEVFAKVKKGNRTKTVKEKAKRNYPFIKLGKEFDFKLEDDNVLCISKWKMKLLEKGDDDSKYSGLKFNDKNWLDVTMGAWEMQLPAEREKSTYPENLFYRIYFDMDYVSGNTRLLIDGFSGSRYQLFVNGNKIIGKGKRSKLDAEIKEVNIQKYVKKGKNLIAVKLTVNRRTDGILDLVKVIGNFELSQSGSSYKIIAPKGKLKIGDWTKQGYPFYSGTGFYSGKFNVPNKYIGGKLFLNIECGEDIAEIRINGKDSKIIPWHPYKVDITDSVIKGENKIEIKITNTLINILEAVQKQSGLFKEPVIEHTHQYELKF